MFEKLNKKDFRRIAICICISVVSFVIVQSYFTKVFPDASIEMDVTKDEAQIIAEKFLANRGQDIEEYMHASRFGWLGDAKRFLEFLPLPEQKHSVFLQYFSAHVYGPPPKKNKDDI